MPRLEVSVSGLPPTLLAGEVVRCSMTLKNSGAMTLQHLAMAVGGGVSVSLGTSVEDSEAAAQSASPPGGQVWKARDASSTSVEGQQSGEAANDSMLPVQQGGESTAPAVLVPQAMFRQGAALFHMPAVQLGVGQELSLPLWIRVPKTGRANLALCWRYKPLLRLDALAYRTARFSQSVQAMPAVELSARLLAGVGSCVVGACMLQLHLHNLSTERMRVMGIACCSCSRHLGQSSSLACRSVSGGDSLVLAPNAAAALHSALAPADDVAASVAACTGAARAALTETEAELLEASRHAASAAAAPHKHLKPTAQRQQQQERFQREDEVGAGADVVVLWKAASSIGGTPRQGFCVVHNQRWACWTVCGWDGRKGASWGTSRAPPASYIAKPKFPSGVQAATSPSH
jgi:hypothetical protein